MTEGTPQFDAISAESSPASEPVDQLASLSPTEYAAWEKDGVLPPASDVRTDSSTVQPDGQAASTDASSAPASEPGKPAKPPKNADTRVQELLADRAQARAEAAQLRERLERLERPKQDAKPGSSPAAVPEWKRYMSLPNAPKEDQFDTYAEYVAASSFFAAQQLQSDNEARSRARAEQHQHADRVKTMAQKAIERINAYKQTDSGFDAAVNPQLMEIRPVSLLRPGEPIQADNVLAEEMLVSDYTPHLMKHFSTPEGIAEWQKLTAMSPAAMLREFGRIEARFESRVSSDARPPSTVTSAPEPPTTLGRKPAAAADGVAHAIKTGDFAAYERMENARELAARR